MKSAEEIKSLAEKLCWEARELSLGTSGEIERLQGAPSPLRFLRDFVLPNKPCVITHAIHHWPALTAWSNSYLRAALVNQQVNVHFTPDGFADALVDLDRLSTVFGCPTEDCPAGARLPQSNLLHPRLHRDAGAITNAHTDGRDDVALNENRVTQPTAAISQLNCDIDAFINASADDAYMDSAGNAASKLGKINSVNPTTLIFDNPWSNSSSHYAASKLEKDKAVHPSHINCDADAVATKGARSDDDSGGASGVLSEPVSIAKNHSPMGLSCNQQTDECHSEDVPAHPLAYDARTYVEQATSSSFKSREEKLQQAWFVTAHVERVPFSKALDFILQSEIGNVVAYAQEQNSCFLSEYSALAADAETHLPWATEAFGCLPDAVNLWIGNEKAVTSFHKDHYENLYAVIAGEKHFTLLPPTDVHRLCIQKYRSACYVKHKGRFTVKQGKPDEFVPWVSVDPYPPPELAAEAKAQFPEFFNGPSPFTCTLQAGDILYLPSMWFHHVRQSPDSEGRTIALNFWYDMQFDVKYAYFKFLESLMLNS